MIRECSESDFERVFEIINAAAMKYQGVIPDELWRNPFVSKEYLESEIAGGVSFSGEELEGKLVAVMGVQDKADVNLIRHSYVLPNYQRQGLGSNLVAHYLKVSEKPVLVGCLKAMDWAISFYEKHGFRLVSEAERDELRAKYWSLSATHVENSVVLAEPRYFALNP